MRYNNDGKYLVDSRKVVKMFPGNKVTLRYNSSSKIRIQPKVGNSVVLSLRESRTECHLYLKDSLKYVEGEVAVEPRIKELSDKDKCIIHKRLPYMYMVSPY